MWLSCFQLRLEEEAGSPLSIQTIYWNVKLVAMPGKRKGAIFDLVLSFSLEMDSWRSFVTYKSTGCLSPLVRQVESHASINHCVFLQRRTLFSTIICQPFAHCTGVQSTMHLCKILENICSSQVSCRVPALTLANLAYVPPFCMHIMYAN